MRRTDKDTFEGDWKLQKAKAMEQWGTLTDADLDVIAEERDQLAGRLQERHGLAKKAARVHIREMEKRHAATAGMRS